MSKPLLLQWRMEAVSFTQAAPPPEYLKLVARKFFDVFARNSLFIFDLLPRQALIFTQPAGFALL